MEKKREPNWPFAITSIASGCKERALRSCSADVRPLIKGVFEKCEALLEKAKHGSKTKAAENQRDGAINFMYATQQLAQHTSCGQEISDQEMLYFEEIINVFKAILDQPAKLLAAKTLLIKGIISRNKGYLPIKYGDCSVKEYRIFESFRSLLMIIHLIDKSYEELVEKGFSLETVWCPFAATIKRENEFGHKRPDEEKMRLLFDIINGTKKFHPVYETTAVGYAIVPENFNELIIENRATGLYSPTSLPKSDTTFVLGENGYQAVSSDEGIIKRTFTID